MASQTSTKASQIGWMFVPQYYTFVNKDPARLHCFYTKRSTLIHGVEGEDSQPCYGQQEIHEKIMSLGFEDCKVFVSTVDSQSSAEGGIIVQVVGELSNKGGPWRKFAQTFFLAEQPNGYFVLNDIFRYIKEESDEEEAALAEEGNTTATAGGDAAAAAAPSSSQQQEISYDQMANAAIVGGQPQQETSAHAGGHDFELAQQHGAPGDAAGVTVAPPQEANQEQTRASLEGLVNGQVEQQQVVELHDDLQPEEAQEQQPAASASASEEAPAARVNGTADSSSESAPLVPTEADAPSSAADPAAAIAEAQQAGETSSAPVQSQSSTSNTPASLAAAPVQETSKPAAPKSWAHLAAAGSGKWRSAVVSSTAGVSSSVPASSSGASRSSTSAGPSDKAQSSSSSTNQKNNNNSNTNADNKGERSEATQQQSRSGKNSETRTPNFTNVETGFSIVVSNITENMSHGLLRQRLSDEFAQLHGSRKEWAKLSYLDIDRQKGVAYVDFEKEWALKKAVEKGTAEIEGTVVTITAGKGGRRDASGLGTGRSPQTGGKGRGDGPRQGQGQSQGQGQGQGQRGGAGAGAGAGRGGSREGGAQRSQRGGRGAGDKQQ